MSGIGRSVPGNLGEVSDRGVAPLLDGERGAEVLGVLDAQPLLVVDLSSGSPPRLPPRLAAVVVGILREPAAAPAPGGVDVALCAGDLAGGPPGWVAVPDVEAELELLGDRIGRAGQAATILCQVLRLGEGASVEHGLLVESLAYSTLQSGPRFAEWLAGRGAPSRVRDEHEPAVVVERRGDTLEILLSRPHVRNAVDARLRDQLVGGLELAETDATIATVHLRGAGTAFSSGGDLDEFGTRPDGATAHLVRTTRSPALLLARLASRTVAHLHGACMGAGIELPAFAGRVMARPDVRIGLPELDLGLIPGAGGTVSLPRRIGRHRTAWLALRGATIGAPTAVAWGLADEIERTAGA